MHAHVQGSCVYDYVNTFKYPPIIVYMAVLLPRSKMVDLIVLGGVLFKIMSTARV